MIRKSALIHLENKEMLIVHKKTIDMYISPGGKIEKNENELECLHREIMEELNCKILNPNYFKSFFGKTHENKDLELICYFGELIGNIKLNPEDNIDGYFYISKNHSKNIKLADLLKYEIIPDLVNMRLM